MDLAAAALRPSCASRDTGSFSAAAHAARRVATRTQPHHPAGRGRVGARLFDRDTRNVVLTHRAPSCGLSRSGWWREFGGAYGALARFVAGQTGRLTIAALPSIAAVLLVPAIARFARTNPDVEVPSWTRFRLGAGRGAEGRADAGLTIRPAPEGADLPPDLLSDGLPGLPRRRPARRVDAAALVGVLRAAFVAMAPESSVRPMTDAALLQARLALLRSTAALSSAPRASGRRRPRHHRAAPADAAAARATGLVWRRLAKPACIVRSALSRVPDARFRPPGIKKFMQDASRRGVGVSLIDGLVQARAAVGRRSFGALAAKPGGKRETIRGMRRRRNLERLARVVEIASDDAKRGAAAFVDERLGEARGDGRRGDVLLEYRQLAFPKCCSISALMVVSGDARTMSARPAKAGAASTSVQPTGSASAPLLQTQAGHS